MDYELSNSKDFLLGDELSFPTVGVIPKEETGAAAFLKRYPNYDGKGVLAAILDTGSDPGSDGLLVTPDGKPKFIDVIDATGSGDVDTTKIATMDAESRIVTGLTGRQLKIPESWQINDKNEFRIGLIRSYRLFPKVLIRRLDRERGKKFDAVHGKKLDSLRREIEMMAKELENESANAKKKKNEKAKENENDKEKKDDKDDQNNKGNDEDDGGVCAIDLKGKIEDAKQLLALLEKESCTNCGPVFDLLVWHTGSEWLAYMDTSSAAAYYNCECGSSNNNGTVIDLSLYQGANRPMTNFRVRQEYCKISTFDNCNFVLNIYDDGNCVSVVTPAGSHGTHVAGIVGAYFKDDPSKNGVAPGCQLVSVKIGDTRLGSMETNQGLLRALTYVKELKCDVVNMSYGEPTTYPFAGAFADGINDLVWKYGTIFVSSAGNDGPCLSTAGAPQAATSSIIGIGAIFSPAMINAEYCLANSNLPVNSYTWSSRGPTTGGAMGVKLCAPGGAIAPVPTFTLNKYQLMNGTSMSSPNACGNVALLLSGLKQRNVKYSPNGIETALINTARLLPKNVEQLSYGYGLIQIHKAFDYCNHKEFVKTVVEMPVHFDVSVSGGPNNMASGERGIYIRNCGLLNKEHSYNVFVDPVFHDSFSNEQKTDFEFKCSLRASQPRWVSCANFAMIAHGGRGFQVKVDTRQLRQFMNGSDLKGNGYQAYYSAEILGFDSKNVEAGPLFRIPITVVNPIIYSQSCESKSARNTAYVSNWSVNDNDNRENKNGKNVFEQTDDFNVGTIARVFHAVPTGVCAAKISINTIETDNDKRTRFSFATSYNKGYRALPFDRWFRASTGSTHEWMFQVEPSTVLETTMTQYALDDCRCRLKWRVEFVGPLISSDHIYLNDNAHFTQVSMQTNVIEALGTKPEVSFDRYNTYVAPKYATTGTLSGNRGDLTMSDELYYYLELEYEFDSECSGDTFFQIPKIADLLYESFLGGMFYMVFDKNKKLVGSGEAFREKIKMEKGDKYLYKVQIRHSSLSLLESLKTMKLSIDFPLSPSVSCDLFYGKRSMIQNKNKVGNLKMPPFRNKALYIATPSKDVSIKNIKPGDHVSGWLKLDSNCKNSLKPRFRNTGCAGPASYCVPVECVLGPANSKTKAPKSRNDGANGSDSKSDEKEEKPSLEDKQRDMTIDWIKKLKGKEQLEAFGKYVTNGLINIYPNHLPLLELQMNVYVAASKEKGKEAKYGSMVADTCDAILNTIDPMAVSAHFGRNGDSEDKEWSKADKKYKEEKQYIIKALFRKLRIVYDKLLKEDGAAEEVALSDAEELAIAEAAARQAIAESEAQKKESAKDNDNANDQKDETDNVTTTGDASAKASAAVADGGDANGDDNVDADGKQDEKSEVLLNDTDTPLAAEAVAGPATASTSGLVTGVTGANVTESSLYDKNESNPYRMVFIRKDKMKEFENLIKDIKQWTDLDKDKSLKDDWFEIKLWKLKQEQKFAQILKLVNGNDFGNDKKKSFEMKFKTFSKYFGKQFGYLVEQKALEKYEKFPKEYRLF